MVNFFANFHPFIVALALALLCHASVMTQSSNLTACSQPVLRQEWRTLSAWQKEEYINAVKCLQSLPAKSIFEGVKTRFDDFQAVHINMTLSIHYVGQFLPWHRRFVVMFESALRDECNYTGASPYWDWTKDADSPDLFRRSPVFDPDTGFGGDGAGTNNCVPDGPFSTYTISLGPGDTENTQCLSRIFNSSVLPVLTSKAVRNATIQPTFELFRAELEGHREPPTLRPHGAGHLSVGGVLGDLYSSPGDPLFYLHHGNIDRIWWEWQMLDPEKRLYEISGPTSINPPFVDVTLDFLLTSSTLAPPIPIRDVMNICDPSLCYTY